MLRSIGKQSRKSVESVLKKKKELVTVGTVASTRVQSWGDEPCEPTVRLPDWSEVVASYSRMKTAWGWANGRQPILVCYIRKYVIILAGIFPLTSPQPKYWGGCVPGIPGGVDASGLEGICRSLYSPCEWLIWPVVQLNGISVHAVAENCRCSIFSFHKSCHKSLRIIAWRIGLFLEMTLVSNGYMAAVYITTN